MHFKDFRNSVYSKLCIFFFYYSSSLPQKLVYHKCSSSTDCKNLHFFQGASTYHIPFSCTVKKQTITYRTGCVLIQLFLLVSCSNANKVNKVTWRGGLNVGKESPYRPPHQRTYSNGCIVQSYLAWGITFACLQNVTMRSHSSSTTSSVFSSSTAVFSV